MFKGAAKRPLFNIIIFVPLISDGEFGAHMLVSIQNDGPVTIEVNSPPPKQVRFILH